MNKQDARAVIEGSLARGSGTPATWTTERDTYVAAASSQLLDRLIDPISVRVVDETFNYGEQARLEASEILEIARDGDRWLLYSPAEQTFSLAFGPDEKSLSILGFASTDALAEWLG